MRKNTKKEGNTKRIKNVDTKYNTKKKRNVSKNHDIDRDGSISREYDVKKREDISKEYSIKRRTDINKGVNTCQGNNDSTLSSVLDGLSYSEIQRGMILSEILGKPVSRRNRQRVGR